MAPLISRGALNNGGHGEMKVFYDIYIDISVRPSVRPTLALAPLRPVLCEYTGAGLQSLIHLRKLITRPVLLEYNRHCGERVMHSNSYSLQKVKKEVFWGGYVSQLMFLLLSSVPHPSNG